MAIPLLQMYRVAKYLAGRKLRGDKRYPLVLMLEPLFQCNLACAGCGKIDYPKEILQKRVSVEDALKAVDECGAPMVSIPGGEPLIHKEMPQIVAGIVARKKFVYLCTNAILLAKHIDEYQPSPYLTFSIHLDGNRERHDESVCQEGVFDKAVAAIRLARGKGFRVTINCTLFNGENPDHVAEFFDTAMSLGIEGITVSPGYSYHHAPRQDVFLGRTRASSCSARSSSARNGRPARVVVQSLRPVPGFPRGKPDLPVHALEQSDLQRVRLAAAVLSACPTRDMRRATGRSSRTPSGTNTASATTRAATIAWRIAASRARRSMTRSVIPSRRMLAAIRGPKRIGSDGAGIAVPLRRGRGPRTVATVSVKDIKRMSRESDEGQRAAADALSSSRPSS